MRKLKLELETLRVESFEVTDEEDAPRGTVHGNSETQPLHTDPDPGGSGLACWSANMSCQTGGDSCNYCVEVTNGCHYQVTDLC